MLALETTADRATLTNKLIEGIAHGHYRLRYLLGPKAEMRSTPWLKSWSHGTLADDFHVLLACRAIHRQDASEFQAIFPACNAIYGYRFQLSILEEAARSGNREIVTILLPYTMTQELHASQTSRINYVMGNATRLRHQPNHRGIETGFTRALVPIAIKSENREALEVWFEALKKLPGQTFEATTVSIMKALMVEPEAYRTKLSEWFWMSLSQTVTSKNIQHATFVSAIESNDIATIDSVLSDEDFDPCFVPPGKDGNLLLVVIRNCKNKWYRSSVVKALLERGVHPNTSKGNDPTPLHKAISEEDHDLASLLLDFGADVYPGTSNSPIAGRRSQLLVAAVLLGHSKIVKMLLDKGVSPYIKGSASIHRVQLITGPSPGSLWGILWQYCGSNTLRRQEYDERVRAGAIPLNYWEAGQLHAAAYSGVNGLTSDKQVYETRVWYRLLEVEAFPPQTAVAGYTAGR